MNIDTDCRPHERNPPCREKWQRHHAACICSEKVCRIVVGVGGLGRTLTSRRKRQTVLRPNQNFAIEFGLMPPYMGTPPPPEVGLSSTVKPWLEEDVAEVLSDTEPGVDDLLGYAMFPDEPSPPLPELELDMGGSEPYIPDELALQFEPEFNQPLPDALPQALPEDPAITRPGVPDENHGQGPAPVKPKQLRYDKAGCVIQTDNETDESYVTRMADLRALKEKRRRLDRQGASQVIHDSMGPVLRILENISSSDPQCEGTKVPPASPFEEPKPSQFPTIDSVTGRGTRASSAGSIEHLRYAGERLSSRASSRGPRSPLGDLPWYDDYEDGGGGDYDDFLNLDSLGDLASAEMSDSLQRPSDIASEHYDCLKRLQNMNCSEVAFSDMLETKCRGHAARAFMDLLWLANNSYVALRQDPTSTQIIIKQTRPASY